MKSLEKKVLMKAPKTSEKKELQNILNETKGKILFKDKIDDLNKVIKKLNT